MIDEVHAGALPFARMAEPLSGQRVLVTRARDQALDLVRALEDQGARPISFPTIEITDPTSWDGIDRALAAADSYDWLVFTSSNAVQRTLARLAAIGGHPRAFGSVRMAAVGKATAAALRTCGLPVDLVPRTYDAEGLLEAFEDRGGVTGERILLPRAAVARDVLPRGLERAGAEVTVAEVYRTTNPRAPVASLLDELAAGHIDVATFTSSSTVRNFVEALGERGIATVAGVRIACIGRLTAGTARDLGLEVHVVAHEATIPGLVRALVEATRGTLRPRAGFRPST